MKSFKVTVNSRVYDVSVEEQSTGSGKEQSVAFAPQQPAKENPVIVSAPAAPNQPVAVAVGETPINAPLSGTIISIKVKPGNQVKAGQVVLTLEALKMENEIVAPAAGVIKEIRVQEGNTVNLGDVLLTLQS